MSLKRKRTDNGAENIDIGSGTVSDPSIAFTDGSGFYSVSNGVVGVTCAGTRGLAIEASKSLFPSGSASAPSIVMGSDLTSGLYTPGSGSVGVTCSGTQVLKFGSNIQIPLSTASTSQSSGALVVTGGIGVGGNSTLGQTTFDGNIDIPSGSASAPSLAMGTDLTSGLYSPVSGSVGVTCSGTQVLKCNSSGVYAASGSSSNVGLGFLSSPGSGLLYTGGGGFAASVGGTSLLQFGTNVQIPLSTASSSQSSGALVVTGGIGVGGNSTLGQTTFAPSGTTSGLISSSGYLGYAGLGATLYTVRLTAGITNATGDGTTYTLFQTSTATDSSTVRSGVSFNSSTGVFTISAAGTYLFIMLCSVGVLTSAMTNCHMNIVGSTYGSLSVSTCNPYACQSGSSSTFTMAASTVLTLVASETVYFACTISGSTKTASITGGRMTILQLA